MYAIGTYPTDNGDRQVLLIRLPSNRDELALIDVPAAPAPLDYAEIYIISRDVDSISQAGDLADEHLERSAGLGRPATGDSYLDDAAHIASMQRALSEAAR